MKPSFVDHPDFIIARKPHGFTTHASAPHQPGYCEYLGYKLQMDLKVVHRLDSGTSGLLLFAKNAASAKGLAELFFQHQIQKTYFFLTDRPPKFQEKTYESYVFEGDKKAALDGKFLQASKYHSKNSDDPNSKTYFQLCSKINNYYLIKAMPASGKPHQIRLHALDLGIPILGDQEHGGSSFFRLMLFANELKFSWNQVNLCYKDSDLDFQNPEWLQKNQNLLINPVFHSVLNRKYLFGETVFQTENSFRLSHFDVKDLAIDNYGETIWVYNYGASFTDIQKNINDVQKAQLLPQMKRFIHCPMDDRGRPGLEKKIEIFNTQTGDQNAADKNDAKATSEDSSKNSTGATTWTAIENNLRFSLRTDMGFSPGLFLDQRENRKWVLQNSEHKSVLNLFAYSGGFSLAAAVGGASQVCTVDVSAKFNLWAKENFLLNGLSVEEKTKYEFWAQDSLLFLKGCQKRQRKFDLIICDPPSFGRSKEGVFSIDKDWDRLFDLCLSCLDPNGVLLFSSNYEKWTVDELLKKIKFKIKGTKFQVQPALRGPDFEPFQQPPILKSFFVFGGNHSVNISTHGEITNH